MTKKILPTSIRQLSRLPRGFTNEAEIGKFLSDSKPSSLYPEENRQLSLYATTPSLVEDDLGFFRDALKDSTDPRVFPPLTSYAYRGMTGISPLQKAMSQYLGEQGFDLKKSQILFCQSVPQALGLAFDSRAVEKGDVLINTPTYSSFSKLLSNREMKMVPTKLNHETDYKLTPKILQNMLRQSPNATMLILINPDNPSGKSYDQKELSNLSEVILETNVQRKNRSQNPLILFNDRVSHNIDLGRGHPGNIGIIPGMEDCTIVASSLSKELAPSLQVAWFLASNDIAAKIVNHVKDDPSLSDSVGPSLHSQYVAEAIYGSKRQQFEDYSKKLGAMYQKNFAIVEKGITEINDMLEGKFGTRPDGKKYAQIEAVPDNGLQCLISFPGLKGMSFPKDYIHEPNPSQKTFETALDVAWFLLRTTNVKVPPEEAFLEDGSGMRLRVAISRGEEVTKTFFDRAKEHLSKVDLSKSNFQSNPVTTISR